MSSNPFEIPKNWGNDYLSNFQNRAFQNELATFVQAPQWQAALLDVATVLNKCGQYAIEQLHKTDEPSAILLFLAANNQFLASVRSVSAGHCLATYPTGRATVENALYGWYLSNTPEAAQRWNNKPNDKDGLRNWNKEFRFSVLTKKLSAIDNCLPEWANYLHQTAIDFGAHPNRDALYSNMVMESGENEGLVIKVVTLHPWNALSISTMKFTIETGMIATRLFEMSFSEASQQLNLREDLFRLTRNLSSLQDATKLA